MTVGKSRPKMWDTSSILLKLPNVNNHPMGENSPIVITLVLTFTVAVP
jgi:hypothetical protein